MELILKIKGYMKQGRWRAEAYADTYDRGDLFRGWAEGVKKDILEKVF